MSTIKPMPAARIDLGAVKIAIHRQLLQKLNLSRLSEVRREAVRREVTQILETLVVNESTPMSLQEREKLSREVQDEVFGLGPLEPLLADPTITMPKVITGFPLIDSLIAGNFPFFYSTLAHLILPALALALISFGLVTRITRSAMLESLRSDYVRTATMKGVGTRRAVYVHALKNSLLPVITIIALTFAYVIAGAVVVEEIFGYEGMGYLITEAVYNYDYPTLIGSTIVIVVAVVIINFVADVLYAVIDPRIRLGD